VVLLLLRPLRPPKRQWSVQPSNQLRQLPRLVKLRLCLLHHLLLLNLRQHLLLSHNNSIKILFFMVQLAQSARNRHLEVWSIGTEVFSIRSASNVLDAIAPFVKTASTSRACRIAMAVEEGRSSKVDCSSMDWPQQWRRIPLHLLLPLSPFDLLPPLSQLLHRIKVRMSPLITGLHHLRETPLRHRTRVCTFL